MNIVFLFLSIMPGKIWYLKYLLEGHDGLAMLTTVDRDNGLVRLSVPRSRYVEIIHLLENMADEIGQKKDT